MKSSPTQFHAADDKAAQAGGVGDTSGLGFFSAALGPRFKEVPRFKCENRGEHENAHLYILQANPNMIGYIDSSAVDASVKVVYRAN